MIFFLRYEKPSAALPAVGNCHQAASAGIHSGTLRVIRSPCLNKVIISSLTVNLHDFNYPLRQSDSLLLTKLSLFLQTGKCGCRYFRYLTHEAGVLETVFKQGFPGMQRRLLWNAKKASLGIKKKVCQKEVKRSYMEVNSLRE